MSAAFAGVASVAWLLAACSASGPRCYQEGAPQPARVSPRAQLLVGISGSQRSPKECPMNEPPAGAPCALPLEPATDSEGRPVEVWATCYYAHQGMPCDPDFCTCRRAAEGMPPVFSCSQPAIE